MFNKVKLYLI